MTTNEVNMQTNTPGPPPRDHPSQRYQEEADYDDPYQREQSGSNMDKPPSGALGSLKKRMSRRTTERRNTPPEGQERESRRSKDNYDDDHDERSRHDGASNDGSERRRRDKPRRAGSQVREKAMSRIDSGLGKVTNDEERRMRRSEDRRRRDPNRSGEVEVNCDFFDTILVLF